jgi:hypothetical protein
MRFYKPVPLLVALLSAVAMYGQPAYRIADYMPMRLGDTLQLQNMLDEKLPPLVATYSDTLHFKGQFAFKRKENAQFRIEQLDAGGWKLFAVGLGGGKEIIFDQPPTLLPATVKQGVVIKLESNYILLETKQKKGSGRQTFEIKVEGNDSSRTPLQNFADCFVITTTVIRYPAGGTTEGYTVKEWYARDIGLIKSAGEVFTVNAAGKRLPKGRVALMLERAVVNGVVMEKE